MRLIAICALLLLCTALDAQGPPPEAREADAAFQAGDWTKAVELYQKVTEDGEAPGGVWFRLGYALHALGRLQEAIPVHRKAAEFPQIRPVALYNLGCAYALTGKPERAFEALGAAVDAGFDDPDQLDGDSDLASLRGDPRYAALMARVSGSPAPAATSPHRQFDFWLGTWDVYNPQGKLVGHNVITALEKGHIIHEKWTSANGGSGQSMNYFDPADRLWKQVWVDAGGGVVHYQGKLLDGAMRFTGTNVKASGEKLLTRASFTPLEGGKVRQFIEHSADGGQSWKVYFDGTYVKAQSTKKKEGTSL